MAKSGKEWCSSGNPAAKGTCIYQLADRGSHELVGRGIRGSGLLKMSYFTVFKIQSPCMTVLTKIPSKRP